MNRDVITAMADKMKTAIESGDTNGFVTEMGNSIENMVRDEVTAMAAQYGNDEAVLAQRGIMPLTRDEKACYTSWVEAAKNGLTNTEVTLPVTIENKVYENMVHNHELLARIDFHDTKGLTDWIISKNLNYAGAWGDLNGAINASSNTEATAAFAKVEFANFKLSCFIPVPLTMLELGLVWIDQYVVRYLSEIAARKLEDAIVNGTGQKMPFGMIKTINIENPVVPAVTKATTDYTLTDLSTSTIGMIAAALTDGGERVVKAIDMIVNPVDYWKHVYPALYYTNADGQVVKSNVPLNVIQSNAVASDHAVFGLLDNYFATIGLPKKVQHSDEYKFLEDVRTYKCKMVAFGTPKDNTSFVYADISGLLEAAVPTRAQKSKA